VDAKLVNPFIDAFTTVMPQIGFQSVTRGKVSVKDKPTISRGVAILVGFTRDVRGNVIYNMEEAVAKSIASTMMCGMPVDEFNDMAQSAISELSNMLTANASTNIASLGLTSDISTPSLTVGTGFSIKIGNRQYIAIEMNVDGKLIEVNISLE